MHKKLLGFAAAGAMAVALPLQALATINVNFTYTPSPLTHDADSYVTSSFDTDGTKTLKSSETVLPFDEHTYHHGDSGTPADGTEIGTANATAHWISSACSSSTIQFLVYWIAPDGGYTPQSGWIVVAETQVKSNTPLFSVSFDAYVIENSSGDQKVEVPSYPNLACTSSTYSPNQITQTLGKVGTTTFKVHRNPSTVGTFTVTISITYTDGSGDSGSASYTTT